MLAPPQLRRSRCSDRNSLPARTGLALIAAMIVGASWAAIPGALRAYRGVNEVITTLMMVYIGHPIHKLLD